MKRSNNRGAALVQVLIVLLVLAILGTSFLTLSTTEYWQGERDHKEVQAYYYAKSGTEAVLRLFATSSQAPVPFYLHGNLTGLSCSAGTVTEGLNEDIVTSVTQSGDEITLLSTGSFQEVKKTITYIFTFTTGGSGSVPDIPPVGPPGDDTADAVIGDPLEDGGIGWYDSGGELTSGSPEPSDKPVVFESPSVTEPFIYKNDNSANYMAPAMYFRNFPDSLLIRDNMELRLNANFISFSGDINGAPGNIASNNGKLTLRVLDSEINGGTIGGIGGFKYGVVFLGGRLKRIDSKHETYLSDEEDRGFYYFQEGLNLVGDTLDSNVVQKKLIRIDNLSGVNFADLKYTITVPGGIGDGQYQ